jgi:hypothetical protein
MNLFYKGINKERNKIKLFPVANYENKLLIIYSYTPEDETFLPSLIEGSREYSPDIEVIVTPDEIFCPIESFEKVIYKDGELSFIKPKTPLLLPDSTSV